MFEANFFGAAAMIRAVLPRMRERRSGHVVNITSVGGLVGNPGSGYYAATKFALEGLGEALARETEGLGIKVTAVEPGPFRTDWAGRSLKQTRKPIDDYAQTSGTPARGHRGAQRQAAGRSGARGAGHHRSGHVARAAGTSRARRPRAGTRARQTGEADRRDRCVADAQRMDRSTGTMIMKRLRVEEQHILSLVAADAAALHVAPPRRALRDGRAPGLATRRCSIASKSIAPRWRCRSRCFESSSRMKSGTRRNAERCCSISHGRCCR